MRRILSFIGSILGTIFSVINTIIMFLSVLLIFDILSSGAILQPTAVIGLVIIVVVFACSVTALVLNICSIVASKNAETLRNKKRVVITAVVFNLVCGAYLVYTLMSFSIINFLNALGLIAASVLMIVDLVKLKKEPVAPVEAPAENSENV